MIDPYEPAWEQVRDWFARADIELTEAQARELIDLDLSYAAARVGYGFIELVYRLLTTWSAEDIRERLGGYGDDTVYQNVTERGYDGRTEAGDPGDRGYSPRPPREG